MAYVYRFIDRQEKISYVGFTGQTMDQRMSQHFSDKGHLDSSCYNNVSRIEYKKYKTKSDAIVMETYYINLFKPSHNKQNKKTDALTIEIEDNQDWKLYKELRPLKPLRVAKTGTWWKVIATIYFIYAMCKLMGII